LTLIRGNAILDPARDMREAFRDSDVEVGFFLLRVNLLIY